MQKATDWIALWRELASTHPWLRGSDETAPAGQDPWQGRARQFDQGVKRRWAQPSSPSRDRMLEYLDSESTLLDIGAGTGSWAVPLAPHVRKLTAVEASPAMVEVLHENLAEAGIHNVEIIVGWWPNVQVERHDFTLCSHAMYGFADFPAFVGSLLAATRNTCFLNIRVPTLDGIMAEAALQVWGHPHDSPNGIVAFNALLQMGLLPDFLVEDGPRWEGWVSPSLEDALAEVKRKLSLLDDDRYDEFLNRLLSSRLVAEADHYRWPPAIRTALIRIPAQR